MKLIFAGTPTFAATALEALVAHGHEVALVLAQPPRAAGRGMAVHPGAVTEAAMRLQLPLEQPANLKDAAIQQRIASVGAQVMVVAAYGLLLPQAVLDLPTRGCLNIHASLLPRWRGAAPVARAIEAGDAETGVGIMQMEAGLDTGPVLLERRIGIETDDTAATLTTRLAMLGATAIVEALDRLDTLVAMSQPAEGATYAAKIRKAEGAIDWQAPATVLERRLRAFDPFPGCETHAGEAPLKIWRGRVVPNEDPAPPGTVIEAGPRLLVRCGQQALEIDRLQKPGGRRQSAADYLRGVRLERGTRFA